MRCRKWQSANRCHDLILSHASLRRWQMKKRLMHLVLLGLLAAVSGVGATVAGAQDYDTSGGGYETPGRLFGGVDLGVAIPLNAYNRFADVGGVISPFIGYKLFQDKDLQLNFGPVGSLQFWGTPADDCNTCSAVHPTSDSDTYAFSAEA